MTEESQQQVVAIPMPLQWQLSILEAPGRPKAVQIMVTQGILTSVFVLDGNDTIGFGNELRKFGKEANTSLAAVRNRIVGANGAPISSVTADDDEDDEE